jgi:hypothetical protein
MLGAIQWNQAVWDGPRVRRVGVAGVHRSKSGHDESLTKIL